MVVFVKAALIGIGLILFAVGFLLLPACSGTGVSFLFFAFAIYLIGAGLAIPPGGAWQIGVGAAFFGTAILIIGYLIGLGVTSCIP